MTVTTAENHASTDDLEASASYRRDSLGPLNFIGSGDHKVIGRMWIVASLVCGLVILAVGALVGFERIDALSIDVFPGLEGLGQAWTLYRLGLVFMVVVPLIIGLATAIIPLQVGSRAIAFPRAANAAFWTWLISAGIFAVSHAIDGGFVRGGGQDAVELSLMSLGFMAVSIMLATVCIMTTIITQRTEGMTLDMVPMFSWSMLVAGAVWLFSLPVLVANIVIIWVDLQGDVARYFANGLTDGIWNQLSWVTDQPQIFAFVLPLLGIAADIMPTGFREQPRLAGVVQGAIGLFGVLSFGAYAQSFFSGDSLTSPIYVLAALGLLLPVLAILGSWADMGRRSGEAPSVGIHGLIAIDAILLILLGGAIAFVRVLAPLIGFLREMPFLNEGTINDIIDPLESLQGTSIAGAVFNVVLVAGLLGALAGLHFWAPKLFGRKLIGPVGLLAALSLMGGAAVTAIPDVISGFLDQSDFFPLPDAVEGAAISIGDGVETLNLVSFIGRLGLVAGVGLMLLNALGSSLLKKPEPSEYDDEDIDNPWGGHTLEWATSSPPLVENFAAPITVGSDRPLLDLAEGEVHA